MAENTHEKKKRIRFSLTNQIIVATIAGLIAGVLLGPLANYIKFIGDIFLRLIQMSIVILVMGAVTEAVGSLEPKDFGKIGSKAISLFILTSSIAAVVGLFLVNVIRPGVGVTGVSGGAYKGSLMQGNVIDIITNFFPKNIFEAMSKADMMQIIVFSVFLGLALSTIRRSESGKVIYETIQHINAVIIQIIKIVLRFAPIGIFALLASVTGSIGFKVVIPLLKFLITMFLASFVTFVILVSIVALYGRINPIRFIRKMTRSIVVAVTTTSSAISLPVQMEDCEERIGISKRVSRLVNPLAMTLNSNGHALTISIACVTVAQLFNLNLSLREQIIIVAVAILSSLGNLMVPGAGIVAMAIAFQITGLPLEGVAILGSVDWFGGIARTFSNVIGDVLVCTFIAINEKEFDRSIFDADNFGETKTTDNRI